MFQCTRLHVPNAGGQDSVLGQGTRSHMPQLRVLMPQLKVLCLVHFKSLSRVRLFATPGAAARKAFLFITNSQSSLKLMSESVTPSNHLILCYPLLLLPSTFPSIRDFLNESGLCIRWPQYWSFSFDISPSNEYSGLISFRMD